MLQVKWSDEATLDLVEVVDYIEQRDYVASSKLHDEIVQAAERLSDVPYLYRIGKVHGTRELCCATQLSKDLASNNFLSVIPAKAGIQLHDEAQCLLNPGTGYPPSRV